MDRRYKKVLTRMGEAMGYHNTSWEESHTDAVFDTILKSLKDTLALKGKVFLDVGAGLGKISAFVHEQGGFPIQIDIRKGEHDALNKVIADAEALPIRGHSVDIAYAGYLFDTRFYTIDIEKVCSEMCRTLKPGGMFVTAIYHPSPEIVSKLGLQLMHEVKVGHQEYSVRFYSYPRAESSTVS
ncbi:MAG: class I SAM-dependent methyltransferase [Minisyncoccia bacterium]